MGEHQAFLAFLETSFPPLASERDAEFSGSYDEVASDLEALLAQEPSEEELEKLVLPRIGTEYDPRRHGQSVRSWMETLALYLLDQRANEQWEEYFVQPDSIRGRRLRPQVRNEVERIGIEEFSSRSGTDPVAVRSFLAGHLLDPSMLDRFEFYDFAEYPDLKALVEGYFYEGYALTASEDWEPIVDRFIAAETTGRIRGAAGDISRLLKDRGDEAAIVQVLDDMRCYFPFIRVHYSPTEWLKRVASHLSSALQDT